MECLGFKPGAAGWQAQTNPLSYGGSPWISYFLIGNFCRNTLGSWWSNGLAFYSDNPGSNPAEVYSFHSSKQFEKDEKEARLCENDSPKVQFRFLQKIQCLEGFNNVKNVLQHRSHQLPPTRGSNANINRLLFTQTDILSQSNDDDLFCLFMNELKKKDNSRL